MIPELHRIESIIQNPMNQGLVSQTISKVVYQDNEFPIYSLTLGHHNTSNPCICFVGGIHGLEKIGTQVVITFLETLLMQLQWDRHFNTMLNKINIYFLPLLNPVGMFNNTRANGHGIDLMRNADIDSVEKTVWFGGGHRLTPALPWYRGKAGEPMQKEAQTLCDFITQQLFKSPFSIVLDCHSGFGFHNQIWFPYAKSSMQPIKHLGEVFCLRDLFFKTYPYQNYRFEPQSVNYITHGDLWDYLYLESLHHQTIFLPLTLEMGSWRWIRKNPLQLRKLPGLFHPTKPHRTNRVLRGHLVLMDFLIHATLSYQTWLDSMNIAAMQKQAEALWYRESS